MAASPDRNDDSSPSRVPTGFASLDRMIGGLGRGELVIIANRREFCALHLAECMLSSMAVDRGLPCAGLGLEYRTGGLFDEIACMRAGIPWRLFLNRRGLTVGQLDAVERERRTLRDAPLIIEGALDTGLDRVREMARTIRQRHDIRVIVASHSVPGCDAEFYPPTGQISRGLKDMAVELHVAVIGLAEFSTPETFCVPSERRPFMSDLWEAAAIERDADVILLMHALLPPGEESDNGRGGSVEVELVVAKNREGPTGVVNLVEDIESRRYRDPPPRPTAC